MCWVILKDLLETQVVPPSMLGHVSQSFCLVRSRLRDFAFFWNSQLTFLQPLPCVECHSAWDYRKMLNQVWSCVGSTRKQVVVTKATEWQFVWFAEMRRRKVRCENPKEWKSDRDDWIYHAKGRSSWFFWSVVFLSCFSSPTKTALKNSCVTRYHNRSAVILKYYEVVKK